jgi:hypothetical protein
VQHPRHIVIGDLKSGRQVKLEGFRGLARRKLLQRATQLGHGSLHPGLLLRFHAAVFGDQQSLLDTTNELRLVTAVSLGRQYQGILRAAVAIGRGPQQTRQHPPAQKPDEGVIKGGEPALRGKFLPSAGPNLPVETFAI